MFFRQLDTEEEWKFRSWARLNYKPGTEIQGYWHTIVQAECVAINRENSVFVKDIGSEK